MYRVMMLADQVASAAPGRHRPGPPELVADGPDQVGLGHHQTDRTWRGTYFDLYVMLDIFSRKVRWEFITARAATWR